VDNFLLNLDALDEAGWVRAEIPLSAFAGSSTARSSRLVRVVVCANSPATFYLSRIDLLGQAQPVAFEISVAPFQAGTVPANKQVLLQAVPTSEGAGYISAFWDFDDRDGVGVDASGVEAVCTFVSPGQYRITCTVVDLRGLRLANTKTLDVVVR